MDVPDTRKMIIEAMKAASISDEQIKTVYSKLIKDLSDHAFDLYHEEFQREEYRREIAASIFVENSKLLLKVSQELMHDNDIHRMAGNAIAMADIFIKIFDTDKEFYGKGAK